RTPVGGSPRHIVSGSGRAALPGPLAFPFPPSRLLAPAELCARRLGPLVSHLDKLWFSFETRSLTKNPSVGSVKFKHQFSRSPPRRDMGLVAAAGPAMNTALAVAAALAFHIVGYLPRHQHTMAGGSGRVDAVLTFLRCQVAFLRANQSRKYCAL